MGLQQAMAQGTLNFVSRKERRRWHKIQLSLMSDLEVVQRDSLQHKHTITLCKLLLWSVANFEYARRRYYTHLMVAQRKLIFLGCWEMVGRQQLMNEVRTGEEGIRGQARRQIQTVPYAELLAKEQVRRQIIVFA